jgi:hypothetical protein
LIVWISDNFVGEERAGGAELTSLAIMEACEDDIVKIGTGQVSKKDIIDNKDATWVLDNIINFYTAEERYRVFLDVMSNTKFVKIEYDYNWCMCRSPIAHTILHGRSCDCLISEKSPFLLAYRVLHKTAKHIFYMSQAQQITHSKYLNDTMTYKTSILSSCFSSYHIDKLVELGKNDYENRWLIVDGKSDWHKFCKGIEPAKRVAESQKIEYDVVRDVSWEELMLCLSKHRGVIFLPQNLDTCPRITIESRIMNRGLICNDNVQHKSESWFHDKGGEEIVKYIRSRPNHFWDVVNSL